MLVSLMRPKPIKFCRKPVCLRVGLATSTEFRVLQGQRFLEVGPAIAHKGRTVDYILDRFAWPGALPVYLGDDDKDEDAFETIQANQGVALVVSALEQEDISRRAADLAAGSARLAQYISRAVGRKGVRVNASREHNRLA